MATGHLAEKFASLGQKGKLTPEQQRRRALTIAANTARARFYASEMKIDATVRACTQALKAAVTAEDRQRALDQMEADLSTYLAAAETLPPSPREKPEE